MGQHQILLVILAVIIIGAAVSVGIAHFGAQSVGANKDGVTTSLTMIGADAYHYRLRPNTLGGGGNSYVGYTVPNKLRSDENALRYTTGTITGSLCQIVGVSAIDSSWSATCVVDDTGKISISYTGW